MDKCDILVICCFAKPQRLQCEHLIERCPEGEHVCLHGSKCVKYGEEVGCDCADAATSFSSTFVGNSCQYDAAGASTDVCTVGNTGPAKPMSFCVNHGICKAQVTPEQAHPGCDCTPEYTGPHCELKVEEAQAPPPPPPQQPPQMPDNTTVGAPAEGSKDRTTVAVLVVSVLALVASVVISVYTFMRNKEERRARDQAILTHLARSTAVQEETKSLASHKQVNLAVGEPELYLGPPRDEDGNALHNVDII